jgi:predicted GNAT family N-acyltransferase
MIAGKWIDDGNWTDSHEIRRKVFINEQNVPPELEIDGTDEFAKGLVVYDNGIPAATGRLIMLEGPEGCSLQSQKNMTVGRVAVLKEYRGQGLGDLVVRMLIRRAFEEGHTTQVAHVQTHARGFYAKLGFYEVGEEYLDAGIPHITMVHEGDVGGNCRL